MGGEKHKQSDAQLKNLEKGKRYFASSKEVARKAQEQSVISRLANQAEAKQNEKTADILIRCLNKNTTDNDGNPITVKEKVMLALLDKSIKGDIRAIELLVKLIEEMPTDKKEILGSLEVQKVFVSPDDHKQAIEHIRSVIAESFKKGE